MRTFWTWTLILAAPALVAAAEGPDAGEPEGTTIYLLLLRQKSVQDDLKLTPELVKKVMTFTNKEADEYGKSLKLGEAERRKKHEELEGVNKKFLADSLSEAQRKRLDQIFFQVTGLRQLTRPVVARSLELTDDQQKKFKEMHTDAQGRLKEIMAGKEAKGKTDKLAKLREKVYGQIESVLTDKQKAKAKAMVGERFTGTLEIEEDEGESKE